jgi:hypothetical protein
MTPVLIPRASLILCLTIVLACNQSPEKIKESEQDKPVATETLVQPQADHHVMLPGFKITGDFLKDLDDNNPDVRNASKFICQVKFIYGFSQPEGMHLLVFPAKSHGQYGKDQIPIEFTEMEGKTRTDLEGIVFGNMELNWKELKRLLWKENALDPNFSHLLLTPFTNVNKQLGYNVKLINKSGQPFTMPNEKGVASTIQFAMNPSPPAEPYQ